MTPLMTIQWRKLCPCSDNKENEGMGKRKDSPGVETDLLNELCMALRQKLKKSTQQVGL